MARGKIFTITSRNILSWECPVDFDGRREMSSLSLKTVVVHESVALLVMETNLRKGGLVHWVPYTKSREKLQELFQSVCVLFCKYKDCNKMPLFFCRLFISSATKWKYCAIVPRGHWALNTMTTNCDPIYSHNTHNLPQNTCV